MILLMITMIVGLVTLVALVVIRFPVASAPAPLPDTISLPDGTEATAFTQGRDWYAVVTAADEILIYDRKTGALKQTVRIAPE